MSRSSKSIWSFTSGIGFSVVSLVVGLISTPYLIHWLGAERYGMWRSLSDYGGYIGLLELGLSAALMPMLARAVSRQDTNALSGSLSEGFLAYRRVFLLMLLGSIGIAAAAPFLVRAPTHLYAEVWIAAAIGIIGAVGILLSPMRVLLDSAQRGYVLQFGLIGQFVIITTLSLLLAWLGMGLVGLAVATLAGSVIYSSVLFLATRKFFPDTISRFSKPIGDPESRRQLWALNRTALAIGICGRASLLSDSIIITQFLGPAVVTGFVLTQRLLDILRGQLQQLGNASWAALAELHANNQHEIMRRRLVEMTRLTCILALAALVPIVAYNRFFIQRWIGPTNYLGDALTILSAFSAIAWAVCSLWGWLFTGTGRLALLLPMSIVTSIVNIAASIGLTWGMRHVSLEYAACGPVAGSVIAFWCIDLGWKAILLKREFGFSVRELARSMAIPMIAGIPFAAGVWWAAHQARPWAGTGFAPDAPGFLGWIALGTEMAIAAMVFLVFAWFALLADSDRDTWKLRATLILRRFKSVA